MVNRLPTSPLTSTCRPQTAQSPCTAHDPGQPVHPPSPLEPVHRLLHQLATDPTVVSDVSPTTHKTTTDTSPTSRSSSTPPVTVAMAQRGLGSAGSVPIPDELWSECAPSNLLWAAAHAPQQQFSQDPMLHLLAQKLTESGLLQHAPPGLAPNAKAYLKPKSVQKCALIVNMIRVNDHCLPPPPFKLPQLDELTHTITLSLIRGTPLYFTKLDISNMFWSCKVPPEYRHTVRIGVRGQVFSFPGLPFGWRASPVIAQKLLAMYIQRLYPGETIVVQYMDDILVLGPQLHRVRAQTQHLVQTFTQHNWVVSAKSELEPSHHVTWMGKQFDGAEGSVFSDPVYIIGIIMLWLNLATRGYRHKHLHRLLGKLQWALRPGRGADPFLAGPYAWLHQGPDTSKCTPTLVLRALAEAIAAALVPWTAPRAVPSGPTWFVDAAGTHSGYWSVTGVMPARTQTRQYGDC